MYAQVSLSNDIAARCKDIAPTLQHHLSGQFKRNKPHISANSTRRLHWIVLLGTSVADVEVTGVKIGS